MRQLLSNLIVAFFAAFFSFLLFRQYYRPEPVVIAPEEPPVQLVRNAEESFSDPTAKPREWATTPMVDFTATSRAVTDAVVNITALGPTGYAISNGSGVIFSRDGYVITNHHVVETGNRFEVTLPNKRRLQARVIGSDPTTDIALIKVDGQNLSPIQFGNSDNVQIGEWVLAVGNPFNLTSTVTAGIVSAKGRNLDIIEGSYSIESFIQTDAVVNPGNSGGALVNVQGELVGINTAIISKSGGYEGYSFAVPSNLVKKVVRDLLEFGEVRRAILGVGILEVNDDVASDLKLPSVEGVYISGVTAGSSADRAGLREGDVIIAINGNRISSVPELQEQVARYRPGDRISLDYYRKGQKIRKENILLQGLPTNSFSTR